MNIRYPAQIRARRSHKQHGTARQATRWWRSGGKKQTKINTSTTAAAVPENSVTRSSSRREPYQSCSCLSNHMTQVYSNVRILEALTIAHVSDDRRILNTLTRKIAPRVSMGENTTRCRHINRAPLACAVCVVGVWAALFAPPHPGVFGPTPPL